MKNSRPANFNGKTFQNLSPTPQIAEGYTFWDALKTFFSRPKTIAPAITLPSVNTTLPSYYSKKPSIIWFGHSSYLIHCDGINILVDPVLSGHASPFSFYIKAFKGADVYKAADMPKIDWLILTHNHYDHLDTGALKVLAPKIKSYIVPTGVSRDLNGIGVKQEQITELYWGQSAPLQPDVEIIATPARHFSGRGFKRNESLWSSYVLLINNYKIFIGGDSGYDSHFKEIGNTYGPFDIAILECGQYNKMWPFIHSMPEELITEGVELKTQVIMPVHWAKFALSIHDWDEPVKRFVTAAEKAGFNYTTPMIGEAVVIGESYPKKKWWQNG